MKVEDFWKLLNAAVKESNGNMDIQANLLEASLSQMDTTHIVNFEEILREKIIECDEYKVMAAAKIINDFVSDDSYLYFRCWIIGMGKEVYEKALTNPDSLSSKINRDEIADYEQLLYVATKAYSEKVGRDEDETFPRDICIDKGLDYDFGAPPTKGDDWNEEELPSICPKLWGKFNG